MTETYPSTKLHIGGKWVDSKSGKTFDVELPSANCEKIENKT